MFYCHRCKHPTTLLQPDKNVRWLKKETSEDTGTKEELTLILRCITCQKDVEIELSKWNQSMKD